MGLAGPGRKAIKRPSSETLPSLIEAASLGGCRPRASRARHPLCRELACHGRSARRDQLSSSGPGRSKFIKAVYRTDKAGKRLVRTAVLSVGRGNGKTTLAATLALAHIAGSGG